MKRVILSVIIFSICVSGALFEVFCLSKSIEGYIEQIENTETLVKKDEFVAASKKCAELEQSWSDTARIIDAVLIHDYVDRISINISQMRAFAENNSADSFFAVSAEAKKALKSIKYSEYPLPENIL